MNKDQLLGKLELQDSRLKVMNERMRKLTEYVEDIIAVKKGWNSGMAMRKIAKEALEK